MLHETENRNHSPPAHGLSCTPQIFSLTSLVESLLSYIDDRRLGGFVNCLFSLLCKPESVTEIRERQEKIAREKRLRHSCVTQKAVMSELETTDTSAKMNGIPAGSSWSPGLCILLVSWIPAIPSCKLNSVNPFPGVGFQAVTQGGSFSLAGEKFQYFIIGHLV